MGRDLEGPQPVLSPADASSGGHDRLAEDLAAWCTRLRSVVDGFPALDVDKLSGEQLACLVRTTQVEGERIAAIRCRALAEFDVKKAFVTDGAGSTQAWLQEQLRVSFGEAKGQVSTARTLQQLPQTREAFQQGDIGQRHAHAIATAVKQAPSRGGRSSRVSCWPWPARPTPGRSNARPGSARSRRTPTMPTARPTSSSPAGAS